MASSPVRRTASAYAAPNSPIASSRRTDAAKPSAKTSSAPPASPSKVMFSAAGRTELQQRSGAEAQEAERLRLIEEERQAAMQCEEEEEDLDEFNPYFFIAHLPLYESVCEKGKICLPPQRREGQRPTLALDLDETLVHCTVEPIANPDVIFPVMFNGQQYQVYARKRPHLDQFLAAVAEIFEVVVFTASQKVYADALLDKLDPTKSLVQHRLFRESCLMVQGNYLKDLHVLGRDLKTSVLVDNSPHAYSYQTDNGVPIESWYDDDSDTELLKLLAFLKTLQDVTDVRPIVRNHFKTHSLVERARNGLSVPLTAPPF
mmetsp:Transcript_6799/g.14750  ORF Transcript_6799/g.14750 Transcript_6799/m.14750 type:complete len:317 (-) Transcript_6799:366-1316(-)|eukprot:CAMPEP_0173198102 /NCGR_PEP_ID=MMETSP1141-20130122/16511_1 /TAXON_ID=483371 /ORGANISM="non described non described, Strain CCMP2298" /LENGTH=316 /DNA_ID=CAMNT_0014122879 /DNA_START=106 /DNA_END=1056 /DNA_ORIENTATION=+